MMSRRIKSGGFAAASSSALAPLVAARTLYCSPSRPASSEMFVGVSSTARIVCGVGAVVMRGLCCRTRLAAYAPLLCSGFLGGERCKRHVELEVLHGPPHLAE